MQAGICLHSSFRAVSSDVDLKIEILEIIFFYNILSYSSVKLTIALRL